MALSILSPVAYTVLTDCIMPASGRISVGYIFLVAGSIVFGCTMLTDCTMPAPGSTSAHQIAFYRLLAKLQVHAPC